jgi:hypothetical protein
MLCFLMQSHAAQYDNVSHFSQLYQPTNNVRGTGSETVFRSYTTKNLQTRAESLRCRSSENEVRLTAALEGTKNKNALYHLLFYEITARDWLNKRFMNKVRQVLTNRKDFRIIHAVTVGQEVSEQPHWAKHKNMPMSRNSWNQLNIKLCQHQTEMMISNAQSQHFCYQNGIWDYWL